jgi:hypothetical protein
MGLDPGGKQQRNGQVGRDGHVGSNIEGRKSSPPARSGRSADREW